MITLPMMMLSAAAFSLAILWCPVETSTTTVLAASGAARSIKFAGGKKRLGDCPSSCGNLSIAYPFGIGPDCSRGPDFSLTCDDATRPPKLFLRDGITQVSRSIHVGSDGYYYYYGTGEHPKTIETSIWRVIPMKSSVRVYNLSLDPPGRSFLISSTFLNITGCDLDVYWLRVNQQMAGSMTELACSTWCPSEEITEMTARNNCSDMGCCRAAVEEGTIPQLSFVHRNSNISTLRSNRTSLLRDRITVASDGDALLTWRIIDEPNCASAKRNLATYACISNHSYCQDHGLTSNGYFCQCETSYRGNPFILGGCTTDKGYNPKQSRADCTRQCANISVAFPFGIEEGCFAREQFQLVCTNATSSAVLQWPDHLYVVDLNVNEGIINYTQKIDLLYALNGGRVLFVTNELVRSAQWVAANLSCAEAKQNTSGYACVSIKSTCVEVNSVGYRCKCSNGFEGNPYIQNGCQDIDECGQPDICKGRVCNNIEGGFFCTECPRRTEFDPSKNQCIRTKQQILLTGIIIGLSGGFSILLLSFVAVFFFRRWKRNMQKQQRRNNFRKNQGLLLEQLISPEKTNIFSLEELAKATNNFDPTRIIGNGGHGMVYKGILTDLRIVAIKKSIVIEYSEIKKFINEVAILSEINHRNVVKLFGCCLESEVPLLVYDYIPGGSLSQVLHAESRNDVSLSWDDYIRIVTEAAGALSYLHSAASISIFHRDVKSSNILLDGNYTAKVSDFGASRLVPLDQTHILTNVEGTFGYLDPEYVQTGKLNEKSDVYSFGVVLLELLVRKKHGFTSESGLIQNLSSYFLHALTVKEISDIVDPQVIKEATMEEIGRVASLAEMCLRLRGEERPTMKQVEMELQILRKQRLTSCQSGPENELQNKTILQTRRAEATCQSCATQSSDRVNLPPRHIERCYSLEEEFMESATLPR